MNRLVRQGFLGPNSENVLAQTTIGIVGLGGGGSHVAQQIAHIGIGSYVLADPDRIDLGNTNRLVGGTMLDVLRRAFKTSIAARAIKALNPGARIVEVRKSWHDATEELKRCDVIIGAVDSFREREQLERFARRYLIPYIDVGMDVHTIGSDGFLVSGQVILSSPGQPCLRCCGLITDERLAKEAGKYGVAGGRPQVVWPNAVLASTAVGLMMQIVTPWHRKVPAFAYMVYDGNKSSVIPSPKGEVFQGRLCPHHPADETGDPLFDIRAHLRTPAANIPSSGWWRRFVDRLAR
jgi:hypothetical protein